MILGITRIRNESEIINYTLDHVAKLVDKVIVMDDASTDNTVEICEKHPIVEKVLKNKNWASDPEGRAIAEGTLRDKPFREALKYNPDWIYYFDADEFADFEGIDFKADAYRMKLFDFYITEEDKDKHFLERQWMGIECRRVLRLFRADKRVKFIPGIGEPILPKDFKVEVAGWVKHYGKAISIEEWEKTCDYYINHRGGNYLPEFTEKWKARKGKAIHTKSDLGSPLIKWKDRYKRIKQINKKIFITGCAKTGTTLVRRLFNAFDLKVYNYNEIKFEDFVESEYEVGKRYWNDFLAGHMTKQEDIDEAIKTIKENNIKIVYVIRDKKGVLRNGREHLDKRYDRTIKQAEKYKDLIDCKIKYEELIDNPDKVQQRVSKELGLKIIHKWSDYPNWYKGKEKPNLPKNYSLRKIGLNLIEFND
jgi:glycosyltransferase involved in cell wall biosynthesis